MTLAVSTDPLLMTDITVTSSLLLAYKTTPANYSEVKVTVYINCCTIAYENLITDPADVSVTGEYVIDKDFFGFTDDILPDGVYQVSIEVTTITDISSQDTGCTLIDGALRCQIAEYVASNCNTDIHMTYFVFKQASTCNCYCSDMCIIYDRILNTIGSKAAVTCSESQTNPCSSC